MKSQIEKISPTHAKITINAESDELKPAIEKVYKEISEQISIPGFRKGKVSPQIIKQRVGGGYILENAINESLNDFYQQALQEHDVMPLSQPDVEVSKMPNPDTFKGDLEVQLELDIRPDVELPDYKNLEIEVDEAKADEKDVEAELTTLRERFGTLKSVDRPAKDGDFVSIDMVAKVDDKEVDSAKNISYQIGSEEMLEGIDEALDGLSAEEDATFNTKLAGGEHAGEEATVKVEVNSVKERELPELDDEFAQMASEFDTVDELKKDLEKQVADRKVNEQQLQAHDRVLDTLIEKAEIPVPEKLIDEEVKRHFEQSGEKLSDKEHEKEVRENAEKSFRTQLLLDTIAEKEEIQVGQQELMDYIVASADQYGMDPNQFAQMLDSSGQVSQIVGEVGRRKALTTVVSTATVKDSAGKKVELPSLIADDKQADTDKSDDVAEEKTEDKESKKSESKSEDSAAKKEKKKKSKKAKADKSETERKDKPKKKTKKAKADKSNVDEAKKPKKTKKAKADKTKTEDAKKPKKAKDSQKKESGK
ncbi:MAG: trigger factor [Micrococcaceae bacterium]